MTKNCTLRTKYQKLEQENRQLRCSHRAISKELASTRSKLVMAYERNIHFIGNFIDYLKHRELGASSSEADVD